MLDQVMENAVELAFASSKSFALHVSLFWGTAEAMFSECPVSLKEATRIWGGLLLFFARPLSPTSC
jgi:hypothetical protein